MRAYIEVQPGRWYYGMYLIDIPKGREFPHGGDIMGCLWRKNEEPTHWHHDYRFRYNAGNEVSPWDYGQTGDRKRGFKSEFESPSQLAAIMLVREAVKVIIEATGNYFYSVTPKADWLIVSGEIDRFAEVVKRTNKSWIHKKEGAEAREPYKRHG